MKFKVYIGERHSIVTTDSWVRCLSLLLDNSEKIVEAGHARAVREDGVIMAAIDLDLGVSLNRKLK